MEDEYYTRRVWAEAFDKFDKKFCIPTAPDRVKQDYVQDYVPTTNTVTYSSPYASNNQNGSWITSWETGPSTVIPSHTHGQTTIGTNWMGTSSKSAIEYTIAKNTKALIRDIRNPFPLHGSPAEEFTKWRASWIEIKTTHPNKFSYLDAWTLTDGQIKDLALMYGEGAHPHDLKIFFKDNWLFCCIV